MVVHQLNNNLFSFAGITAINFLNFKIMNQNHKIVRLTDCYPLHKLQNMKRKKSDNCSLVFEWRGEQGVVNMNYQFEQAQTVINYIVEKMKGVEMMAKAKK